MHIAKTKQNEMEGKTHVGLPSEASGAAWVIVNRNCFVAGLAALLSIGIIGCKSTDTKVADNDNSPGHSSLPLVYDVENTGAKYAAPPLPILGNTPYIEPLP